MENNTIDLGTMQMVAVYALICIPLVIMMLNGLGLVKETVIAFMRMSVQLALVGLYLHVLFDLNEPALTALWMAVMLVVANSAILKRANLKFKPFFLRTLFGTTAVSVTVTLFFVCGIISPTPVYDARYLIPVFGMVLGNCMRGNVLSLERFYQNIADAEKDFTTRQLLGANLKEAIRPYMKTAMTAAISPHMATMATMGIVSLPGMMTGQILGGSAPATAIKYQIAIMVCIFTVMVVGAFVNLLLTLPKGFDIYGMLRHDIFAKPQQNDN